MIKSILGGFAVIAAISGHAMAQERQWFLDATEEDAFLIFGVPETDDTGLSIWCAIGSKRAKIFLPEASEKLKADGKGRMELVAGPLTATFEGTVLENQESGIASLEVEAATSDPIFAAMMAADRLKIHVEGGEQIVPLIDADLEGLLRLCNGLP